MDKIINLVGASGSGKTTIAKELEKLGYNIIHSYTTRNPREEGEWGHTFIPNWFPTFVSGIFIGIENGEDCDMTPNKFRYIDIDEMIAYFNDYEKDEHYFATYEQYQGKGTSIYIVDPNGAKQVHNNVKDAEVITIFLITDEEKRVYRLAERENAKVTIFNKDIMKIEPKSSMMNIADRIRKDREIFKTCKCDYVVDANREVADVLKDVIEIIGE